MIQKLSDREQAVLYGLVRYPNRPDVSIARQIGMPQPTFSNIQRRLKERGLYEIVGVPNLNALGLEIVCVAYGSYNPVSSHEERKEVEVRILEDCPEIFYLIRGIHNIVIFLTSRDYSTVNGVIDQIESGLLEEGVLEDEGFRKVYLSVPNTLIARFFDYSKILYNHFDLDLEEEPGYGEEWWRVEGEVDDLRPNEARILITLINNPDAADITIAEKLDLSRTTISRSKKNLMRSGIFRRVAIPNMADLGFDVFTFSRTLFNPETTYQQRRDSTKWLVDKLPIFLSMVTNKEAVTLYSFRDFHKMQNMKKEALVEYRSKDYIKSDPDIVIYSTEEIVDPGPPDFAPILSKVFKL